MILNSFFTNEQFLGYLFVAHTLGQKLQYFLLSTA